MQPFAGFGDDHRHGSADIDVDDLNHGVDSGQKPVEEAAVALGWDGAGTWADDRGSTAAARLADAVVCTGPLDCGWRDWMRRWWWRKQCWELCLGRPGLLHILIDVFLGTPKIHQYALAGRR
jgi:hypothetical protein